MNYSLKLQVNNEDSWGLVNLIPLATLNVHSHFKNMYVGICYFRVRVCGHMFMCVCGNWRRTMGASVNHVSPLFCAGFVFVVLRRCLFLSLALAGGKE